MTVLVAMMSTRSTTSYTIVLLAAIFRIFQYFSVVCLKSNISRARALDRHSDEPDRVTPGTRGLLGSEDFWFWRFVRKSELSEQSVVCARTSGVSLRDARAGATPPRR